MRRPWIGVSAIVMLMAGALLPGGAEGQVGPIDPVRQDPILLQAFGRFLRTDTLYVESVPDLYPGGYARISLYAQQANLGGLVVDEVWFKLVGASLDPERLARGRLKVTDSRDAAIHGRAAIKSLEAFFAAGITDARVWSDGKFLYAEGTVPLNGIAVKVWLKGFFSVNGTRELFFHIKDARLNALPLPSFLLQPLEGRINPVMSQKEWPVTFDIRAIRMTEDEFLLSSQANLAAPCGFCVWAGVTRP